jgi:sugar phosphate isomerase/epimerase
MKFLFSTGSLWDYSVERCFAFAAAAGFDGLEVVIDARRETRQPELLQQYMAQYQIPIVALHSPIWFFVPGWPDDPVGRLQHTVELAETVGAQVVVHHLPTRLACFWLMAGSRTIALFVPGFNFEAGYKRWLERDYADFQANTSVKLCIENMPAYRRLGWRWHYCHWNRPTEIVRFPALTMDTTHLGTWGLDPAMVYDQWGKHVQHIHLSNFARGKEHQRPQTGELRLDVLLQRLAAANYSHAITLEVNPDTLDAGQPDEQVIQRMAECLAYCKSAAAATSNHHTMSPDAGRIR